MTPLRLALHFWSHEAIPCPPLPYTKRFGDPSPPGTERSVGLFTPLEIPRVLWGPSPSPQATIDTRRSSEGSPAPRSPLTPPFSNPKTRWAPPAAPHSPQTPPSPQRGLRLLSTLPPPHPHLRLHGGEGKHPPEGQRRRRPPQAPPPVLLPAPAAGGPGSAAKWPPPAAAGSAQPRSALGSGWWWKSFRSAPPSQKGLPATGPNLLNLPGALPASSGAQITWWLGKETITELGWALPPGCSRVVPRAGCARRAAHEGGSSNVAPRHGKKS